MGRNGSSIRRNHSNERKRKKRWDTYNTRDPALSNIDNNFQLKKVEMHITTSQWKPNKSEISNTPKMMDHK